MHMPLTVGSLAEHIEGVGPDVRCADVKDCFEASPDIVTLPVVYDGAPLGIVRRHSFLQRMSERLGQQLFANRPITQMMDTDPLIVDAETSVLSVNELILDENQSAIADGFIITNDGQYAGIGTGASLLKTLSKAYRSQSIALNTISSDLMALSEHIDFQSIQTKPAPGYLDVGEFAEGIECLWREIATTKKVNFSVNIASAEILGISADALSLRQAMGTLLLHIFNLPKIHTLNIKVMTERATHEKVTLTVRVTVNHDGNIDFNRYKSHSAVQHCKSIIESISGTFHEISRSPDSFELVLASPAVAQSEEQFASHTPRTSLNVSFGHLLVVDDNLSIRTTTERILKAAGWSVDLAASGYEAIERAQTTQYDGILMDLRMPGMDGLEATRRLKSQNGPNNKTPIIGFTADPKYMGDTKLIDIGMSHIIVKPVRPRQLIEELAQGIFRANANIEAA